MLSFALMIAANFGKNENEKPPFILLTFKICILPKDKILSFFLFIAKLSKNAHIKFVSLKS